MDDFTNSADQREQIRRALKFFHPDNTVFELCGMGVNKEKSNLWEGWAGKKGIVSGWFTDHERAIELALRLNEEAQPKGIYITVNPCTPNLLALADHRLKAGINRTEDNDIQCYRFLLIDIDPVRKKGISSSDDEHARAIERAYDIKENLLGEGWPEPLVTDSGNGSYLVYRVDLSNTPKNIELMNKILAHFHNIYSNEFVDIDSSVYNPGRLTKLYGTWARKGDSLPERPHRLARILEFPKMITPVPSLLLEEIAKKESGSVISIPSIPIQSALVNGGDAGFDVGAYLRHYGREIVCTKPALRGGTLFLLKECVFNPEHTEKEASIIQNSDGPLVYQCFHNSCSGKTWEDARKIISGDDPLTPFLNNLPEMADQPSTLKSARVPMKIYSLADLSNMDIEPRVNIVEGLIVEGLTTLNGKPKIGKSILVMNLGLAVSMGTPFMNRFPVKPGSVLYLALEDTPLRIKERSQKILRSAPSPNNFHIVNEWTPMSAGGLVELESRMDDYKDLRLVIIDTLGKFRGKAKAKDCYQEDYAIMGQLKQVADRAGVGIIVVHHLRKMKGDDPFDEISGTTGIAGAADTNIILKKDRRGEKAAELLITGRDIEESNFALTLDSERLAWKLLDWSDPSLLTENEQRVINVILESGTPMRSGEISERLEREGMNGSTIRSILSKMVERKVLNRMGNGMYVKNNNNTTCTTIPTTTTCSTATTAATVTTTQQVVELVEPVVVFLPKQDVVENDDYTPDMESEEWENPDDTVIIPNQCLRCRSYAMVGASCPLIPDFQASAWGDPLCSGYDSSLPPFFDEPLDEYNELPVHSNIYTTIDA